MTANKKVQKHFGELAQEGIWASLYDSEMGEVTSESWSFLIRRRRVLELIHRHVSSPGRILDVGCGTAPIAALVVKLGFHYIGNDFSQEMIKSAQMEHADLVAANQVEFGVGDVTNIVHGDGSVSAIVGMGLLEYLDRDQLRKAVSELYRVVAVQGVVIVTIPKRNSWGRHFPGLLSPLKRMATWRPNTRKVKLNVEEDYERLLLRSGELDSFFTDGGFQKTGQVYYNTQLITRPFTLMAPRACYLANRPLEAISGTPLGAYLSTGYIGVYQKP